ncbi:MAG: energy transducer TonB [Thermodesulfobacteriota bacterium]
MTEPHPELPADLFDEPSDSEVDSSGFDAPVEELSGILAAEYTKVSSRDRAFRYGIVASFVLHATILVAIPQMVQLTPSQSLLKPGETVTPIRLVEWPGEPKETEPPKQASAISDRDHAAEKERLPKTVPGTPIPGPMGPRMAALVPPTAPEFQEDAEREKPDEEKREPEEKKPSRRSAVEPKKPSQSKPQNGLPRRNLDVSPNSQEIARVLSGRAGSPDFFPEGDSEEVVVDINTRENTFASYLLYLKHKIQGVWTYPRAAAEAGIGGKLLVEFLISREGQLVSVNLLDSSGHAVLDQSALNAIKSAAPYYPLPDRVKAKRLRIRANFIYVNESFFRRIM